MEGNKTRVPLGHQAQPRRTGSNACPGAIVGIDAGALLLPSDRWAGG